MTREEAVARIELAATEMTGTLADTTEQSAAEVLQRYIDAYDMAIAALREQEKDAVPVVRCKDCKNYRLFKNRFGVEISRCMLIGADVANEAFCSYGERKEGD